MGNKLGCNCGPLSSRKPYRYEENQWSATSSSRSFGKRDGHLLRLWAEVFHVTTAGGGTVKWQQVSEDLVPVNITCIQDSPEVVFHITAYNSQVDKILDVRLVQPGTRIGQASECFVYWKDPVTSDTWGLNFTSPIDAKQFRECCSPAFKFSRKASSSYSLKDNNTRGPVSGSGSRGGTLSGGPSRGGSGRINATSSGAGGRRRPLSTPTSPSKSREPQCTCMTAEQYARLRAMDPRFRAASTLPRATPTQQPRQDGGGSGRDKSGPTDNYATVRRGGETKVRHKGTGTASDMDGEGGGGDTVPRRERGPGDGSRGRGSGRGGGSGREIVSSKSVDYSDNELAARESIDRKKSRSKSTDDVTERGAQAGGGGGGRRNVVSSQQTEAQATQTAYPRSRTLPGKSTIGTNTTPTGDGLTDSHTLKRLLKPISTTGSVATSPEMSRRVYHHDGYISEPEIRHVSSHAQVGKRATDALRRVHPPSGQGGHHGHHHHHHERSRGVGTQTGYGKFNKSSSSDNHHHYHHGQQQQQQNNSSPPSDQPVFDHAYYATTPPSSSPEGEGQTSPSPGSPTARLLLEYEQHLRNTLAKGMDAESYSLHTFEAIISQSNENLAVPPNSRSTTLPRLSSQGSGGAISRENFRISHDASREVSRDSDVLSGYYSDFRDRGYLSDHNSRTLGYYDRHNNHHADNNNTKSGYFSDRENRSGYYSDREVHSSSSTTHKYGSMMRQQASVESADSRLCYLTSSEITPPPRITTPKNKTADKPNPPGRSSSQQEGNKSETPSSSSSPPPPPLPPPRTNSSTSFKTFVPLNPPPPPLPPPPEIAITPETSTKKRVEEQRTVIVGGGGGGLYTQKLTEEPSKTIPDPQQQSTLLTPTRTKPKLFPKPVLSPRLPPKKLSIPRRPTSSSQDDNSSVISLSPAASESSLLLSQSPVKPACSPIYSEPTFEENQPPQSESPRVTFAPTATVVERSPVRTPSPLPKDYEDGASNSIPSIQTTTSPSTNTTIQASTTTTPPIQDIVSQNTGRFTVRILPSPSHVHFISQPQPHHVVLRSPRKEAGVATVIPADAPVGTEDLVLLPSTSSRTLPNPKRQKLVDSPGLKGHVRFASEAELYPAPRDSSSPEEEEEVEEQQQQQDNRVVSERKLKKPTLEPIKTAVKNGDHVEDDIKTSKTLQTSITPTYTQSTNTVIIELTKKSDNQGRNESTTPIPPTLPILSKNTIQIDLTHRETLISSPKKTCTSSSPDITKPEVPGATTQQPQKTDISEGLFWKSSEAEEEEEEDDDDNESREYEWEGSDDDDDRSSPVHIHYDPEQAKTVITFPTTTTQQKRVGSPSKDHHNSAEEKCNSDEEEESDDDDEVAWEKRKRVIECERLEFAPVLLTRNKNTKTTQSVVTQGYYPHPSVPSPATASPPPRSCSSQSSSSTTGPTTVLIPANNNNSSTSNLVISPLASSSQQASSGSANTKQLISATNSASKAPLLLPRPVGAIPTKSARHSHLSHYNSIQELYTFVSEVLSSQGGSKNLVVDAAQVLGSKTLPNTTSKPVVVVTAAATTAAAAAQISSSHHPHHHQYTLCKYHLKQKQQRLKQQQLLLHQQRLLQAAAVAQKKHNNQAQVLGKQPAAATNTTTVSAQIHNTFPGTRHNHQHPQPHHTRTHHLQQPSSSSSGSQRQAAAAAAVVAHQQIRQQQNGQEAYSSVQQQQRQAQQLYQPQAGTSTTMTLAQLQQQAAAQHLHQQQQQQQIRQQLINQNIYRPVLPTSSDPSTIPRKGISSTHDSTPPGTKQPSNATLPHPHSTSYHAHGYHHHQLATSTSSISTKQINKHYQASSSGGAGGTSESGLSTTGGMVSSSGGGGAAVPSNCHQTQQQHPHQRPQTTSSADTAPATTTSAFYSTLTPIRQQTSSAQHPHVHQQHAFQPVPQRHHHHHHHGQQQFVQQQQYRTPTHHAHHHHHQNYPSSSSSSTSRYPIQRSVSVAAASTSTTNYSAVQALAATKQFPNPNSPQIVGGGGGGVVVCSSSSAVVLPTTSQGVGSSSAGGGGGQGVFQPLASAPSLLTNNSNNNNASQPVSISLSSSYDYATIQHVQQSQQQHQQLIHQQLVAAAVAAKQQQQQQQQNNDQIYGQHVALQHSSNNPQTQIVATTQNYYYNPLEHPAYANYYQPAESLTGYEEPISRPVSNMSNKSSSEHFYTYPYPRKQQEMMHHHQVLFKPIDWCTLVHWARKAVQSREDDNDIKCECSHGCHEIAGLKRHDHLHNWPHVQPHECNVLFLAKVMQRISDDERMSLTTAVSDDEPGDGANSPKGSRKPAASFNCTGAVRKAGFLSVKKWLLRKRHQVELARRRGWKGYWVCLKGTTLLFYPCDARETSRSVEAAPKHLIIVDGAIMQPIPEHPKRDYIFCLSTAFGDAYLFQAPCQVELESWVHSIHWACAAAFARHRGKTGTLHLLQEEIIRLDKAIESDGKLRHMAELQRSVVADPETRSQLAQQIATWEENIERLHCEQFRLRCYMASLQGGELPNPKSLLSHVSRTTKNTLNRLGVFTVSSFHAYVCARSPSLLSNLLAGRGATKRRAPLLSRSNSASSRRSLHNVSSSERENERTAKISLPENQVVTVPLKDAMSVEEFLVSACARKGLAPMEHFVRVKKRSELPDTNYFVPHRSDLIDTYLSTHEVVEVRAKLLYQVELSRSSLDQMWGFSVEAELVENADRQDELCCYVSRVEDRSVAMSNGIIKGDEILVINGAIVSDLDMMYIESVLQEELSLCLMLRSSRTEPPALAAALAAADAAIAQLVCPPPPALDVLTEDILSHLIVPAPHHESKDLSPSDTEEVHGGEVGGGRRVDSTEIESLLKTAEQVTGICRTKEQLLRQQQQGARVVAGQQQQQHHHHHPLTHQRSSAGSLGAESPVAGVSGGSSPTHVTMGSGGVAARDVEKTKKVVLELIETERAYVKHLTCLLEQYLEPLRHERFLSANEMMAIFGNIREMVTVQRRFLKSLEAALESCASSIEAITHSSDFKNILLNIAAAFLNFADHFKLYSSFCASHSKAQKLLHPTEGNQALQQFLAARNPRQQHSNTLESYLIKPIQRILKYPLLLQQLRNLCDTNTEEYRNLVDALQCMERVAEHINEMQRIHEEYGAIFEHLFRQHQKLCKTQIDLSPGDLLHYGGVEWLNIADFLGKIKKGLELHAMCFVFRTAVVFLCKERLRHKKKLMGSTSKVSDKSEVEIIRYQVLIPVSEVQVRQIGDPGSSITKHPSTSSTTTNSEGGNTTSDALASSSSSNYSWELVHLRNQAARRSEKVYLLSNSTGEFRNAFLRNIRQIIRESVRNMSLPPPRLSDRGGGDDDDDDEEEDDDDDREEGGDDDEEDNDDVNNRRGSGGRRGKRSRIVLDDDDDNANNPIMIHSSEAGPGNSNEAGQVHHHHHYATPEGIDPAKSKTNNNNNAQQQQQHHYVHPHRGCASSTTTTHQAQTLGRKKPPKPPQRHSAGNLEMGAAGRLRHQDSTESNSMFRCRSKTMSDGQEDHPHHHSGGNVTLPRGKGVLGNTPIHLTLSTTSTLSAGSTGSAAKLIQSSSTPGRGSSSGPGCGGSTSGGSGGGVGGSVLPEPTSPIWKPREGPFDSQTLPSRSKQDEPQPGTSSSLLQPKPCSSKSDTLPRPPR